MGNSKFKPTLKSLMLTLLTIIAVLFIINVLLDLLLNQYGHVIPDIQSGYGPQGVFKLWQLTDAGVSPIVFTGSSQMKAALIPSQFDAQLGALSDHEEASVNISVIGGTVKISRELIENLLIPTGIHTIIYGVEMRDLHIGADFNNSGFEDSSLGYAITRPTTLERSASLWLLQHVPLVEYHSNIRGWLDGNLSTPDSISQVDEDGYWNLPAMKSRDLDIIRQQFAPFQTTDEAQADLNGIFMSCQHLKVECIVVNMPLHKDAYKIISSQDEAHYREILYQAAKQADIAIWDFNSQQCQGYFEDADFYDVNHLNHSGARKFTDAMADLYVQQVLGKTLPSPPHTHCATIISPNGDPNINLDK